MSFFRTKCFIFVFLSRNAFHAEMLNWFLLQFKLTKLRLRILGGKVHILPKANGAPRFPLKLRVFHSRVLYRLRDPVPWPYIFHLALFSSLIKQHCRISTFLLDEVFIELRCFLRLWANDGIQDLGSNKNDPVDFKTLCYVIWRLS